MNHPRLLDLFCGEGGAAMGYARAGFDVVGIDIDPQPNYPFEFVQDDAFDYLAAHASEFDVIHASPPCQGYSSITPDKTKHKRLISATSAQLRETGIPYVIENVDGAKRDLDNPFMLCGSTFGLPVRRHRWFETPAFVLPLPCRHSNQGIPIGIYGDHPDPRSYPRPGTGTSRGVKAATLEDARAAMEMPWASWRGCANAVPPAYTEWIGRQLIEELQVTT